ncbi:MAG TPA: DNA-processing protein DprA [Syntrophobacteria bacterium]|nr:DNA-processing protein DprA [Syntrophobacteria bacterium]
MDEEFHWVALALIPGVGARTFHRLLQRFGSPERVFTASRRMLEEIPGLKGTSIEAIKSRAVVEDSARRELGRVRQLNLRLLRWGTTEYPPLLSNIPDPPALLYVKGQIAEGDQRAVAVVGSRHPSGYGLTVCKKLCVELAWQGWTVVSGMARGIDSAAHVGALEGGGRTLAVLGTGLDVVYPTENRKLYERIAGSGAVISELPLGTPPDPGNFPVRNRLISGLALGVVVVEATAKSGSLITAGMALEQGRQVFAVPGPLDREGVAGPHRLIKEGAKLVERAADITEELTPMVSPSIVGGSAPAGRDEGAPAVPLAERERKIWDLLGVEPLHIDPIARQVGLSVAQAAEVLLRLELMGLVKQLPGTLFVRKPPAW